MSLERTLSIIKPDAIKSDYVESINLMIENSGLKIISLPLNISSLEFCLKNTDLIDVLEIHSICFSPNMNDFSYCTSFTCTKRVFVFFFCP